MDKSAGQKRDKFKGFVLPSSTYFIFSNKSSPGIAILRSCHGILETKIWQEITNFGGFKPVQALRLYNFFSCSAELSKIFSLLISTKMPANNGLFIIFISCDYFIRSLTEQENDYLSVICYLLAVIKFHAQLS